MTLNKEDRVLVWFVGSNVILQLHSVFHCVKKKKKKKKISKTSHEVVYSTLIKC